VTASGMGFDVRGSGAVRFGTGLGLSGDFQWSTMRNDQSYAGYGLASGTWPTIEFSQTVTAPVELSADGEVTFGSTLVTSVQLRWDNLIWPWAQGVSSMAGELELTGWLDGFVFDASGDLTVDGIGSTVAAAGSGTLATLQFDSLMLRGDYGQIDARGSVELDPLTWLLEIQTTGLDPAVRLPQWPGALDVTGSLSGHTMPSLALTLSDATVSGELRGQPITATGGAAYESPGRWDLDRLIVGLAGNRLSIDGTVGTGLDITVAVDASTLEEALPDAAGQLQIEGHIGGTRAEPELTGLVRGRQLRYADYSADSLAVDGEIVAGETRSVTLRLTAESVSWRELDAATVSASLSGTAASHIGELSVVSDRADLALRVSGAWADGRWAGQLSTLTVDQPLVGQWQLGEAVALAITRSTVELDRACLTQGEARLCGSSRVGTDADSLELELTSFDVGAVAAALPDNLSVAGRYDARLRLEGPLRRPAGTFETHGRDTVITYREAEESPLEVPLQQMDVRAELSPAGDLDLDALFEGGTDGRVTVMAAVTGLWDEEPGIDAAISGRWADLAALSLLSPDVGEVSGAGSVDLVLDGRLRSPDVRGEARWSEGQAAVPRFGLLVEGIEAEAISSDGSLFDLKASGMVGDGRVDISGTTRIDPQGHWPTQLRVYGSGLQAVRLPEADIIVSPSLEVRAELPNVEVTGAFLVPHARLELEAPPAQALEPSPDTIVHGAIRPERARPLQVRADIRVGLGEDVRYTGAGLDVGLSGAMGLVYESGRDAVASGAVKLSGQYQAYGQTLQIDQGQLLFTGPVTNPGLDVRAVRHIDTTTVGIQLTGTVEAPVPRVFSEPAMSEADALSYLMFGRPLSASGDEETATLQSAAVALGLQQALPVIQRVGETLGLDEFSVQTTAADTGELMAGKRLSPRIYIRYTYGLFNRIGGLLMRFDLNDRFSLETRSGDYRSMDLLYTVERD